MTDTTSTTPEVSIEQAPDPRAVQIKSKVEKYGNYWRLKTVDTHGYPEYLPDWTRPILDSIEAGAAVAEESILIVQSIIRAVQDASDQRYRYTSFKEEVQTAFNELVEGHMNHLPESTVRDWAERLDLEMNREEEVSVSFQITMERSFTVTYGTDEDRYSAIETAVSDFINYEMSESGTWDGDWEEA